MFKNCFLNSISTSSSSPINIPKLALQYIYICICNPSKHVHCNKNLTIIYHYCCLDMNFTNWKWLGQFEICLLTNICNLEVSWNDTDMWIIVVNLCSIIVIIILGILHMMIGDMKWRAKKKFLACTWKMGNIQKFLGVHKLEKTLNFNVKFIHLAMTLKQNNGASETFGLFPILRTWIYS